MVWMHEGESWKRLRETCFPMLCGHKGCNPCYSLDSETCATSTLPFRVGYTLVAAGFQQQTFNFNVAVSTSEHQGSETVVVG